MRSSGPDRLTVRLSFWPDGALKGAGAEGHAGDRRAGANLACAAVTVLLRTAYETAAGYEGVMVRGSAPAPGSLSFEIGRYPPAMADRLRGVGDFLTVGLSSVDREYPGLIDVLVER